MGNLVFQATLGGQVNLVGPNTASTFNLNVPAVSSTIATLTGTETFTNKTLTTPVISSLSSASATALTLQSAGTTAITVDTSQNVGIGTTSPTANLEVKGASGQNIYVSYTGGSQLRLKSDSGDSGIGTTGATPLLFLISNGEKARIDSSGNLLVGTTSSTPAGSGDTKGISLNSSGSSSQIYATGNNDTCAVFNRAGSDGATVRLRRQGSDVGSISTTASATAYNTSSDYRLKQNITPMTGALAKVALLKPVTYKWKVDGSDGEGFIAHELAEVKPDCVSGEKDATRQEEYEVTPAVKDEQGNITTLAVMGTRTVPAYQGVDTSFLVATLTAAIQELKALNDTQAETLTQQTEAINALTARVVALEAK